MTWGDAIIAAMFWIFVVTVLGCLTACVVFAPWQVWAIVGCVALGVLATAAVIKAVAR